jgi:hypothetical protein
VAEELDQRSCLQLAKSRAQAVPTESVRQLCLVATEFKEEQTSENDADLTWRSEIKDKARRDY